MAGPGLVVAYYGGTGRNAVLSQTLATASETEFKIGNDSASTSVIAVLSMPTQTTIQGSYTPNDQATNPAVLNAGFNRTGYQFDANPPYNSGVFDNCKPFLVRLAGTYTPLTGSSSTSIAFKVYLGTSKSGTNIATCGTVTNSDSAGGTYGFLIEAQLKWDSTSQALRGQQWYDVASNSTNSTYNTWKALTTAGSSITTPASLQFCASTTWGASNGGTVAVSEFSITQL
jgi:hypothetical protein